MHRLFFALWPDDDVQHKLTRLQYNLPLAGSPVKSHNFHLTLLFLGDVSARQYRSLKDASYDIDFSSCDVTLDQIGYFNRPNILYAGAKHCSNELKNLQHAMVRSARDLRLAPARDSFVPHVSLFRKYPALQLQEDFESIEWQASSFCLVESHLSPRGAVYNVVEEYGNFNTECFAYS